jgi:hypothetical protein
LGASVLGFSVLGVSVLGFSGMAGVTGVMILEMLGWVTTVVVGTVSWTLPQAVSRAMVSAASGGIFGSDFMVVQCAETSLTGSSHDWCTVRSSFSDR